jgi:hypothetical protein
MAIAVVAAFAAIAPSMASALITTKAETVYGSMVPGAHTDYTIIQKFEYGNGAEPTASTGPGQDLKKWVVDSPAGLVGDPNAVPENKRCNPASFDPSGVLSSYVTSGSCPASSQVGEAEVYLVNDANSGTNCPAAFNPLNPFNCLMAGFPMYTLGTMKGKIYILDTGSDVPTTLGTIFTSNAFQDLPNPPFPPPGCVASGGPPASCPLQPKTKSVLAPVTNESTANNGDTDFRIRTIPADYTAPAAGLFPTVQGHASWSTGGTPLHISRIDQHLYGMADPNDTSATAGVGDVPFLTMPRACGDWNSISYAISQNTGTDNGTLTMDPNNLGDNKYVKSAVDTKLADCTTKPALSASATTSLTTTAREAYPGVSVTVNNPNTTSGDLPKRVVSTLPGGVSVNIPGVSSDHLCTTEQRDAAACPAGSRVGTATIDTPLISAGLTGNVYLIKSPNPGLPYLSVFAEGSIKFRLDATTRFAGFDSSQIETTFDNLPQVPFSKFTVNIEGNRADALLQNRSCPTNGTAPFDGNSAVAIDGFSGATTNSTSDNTWTGCYGAPKVSKKNSCFKVTKKFSASPSGFINVPNIAKTQLQTGTSSKSFHTRQTDSKLPYKFSFTLKKDKFKANKKYYYRVRVTYKDGAVVNSKSTTFKTCK